MFGSQEFPIIPLLYQIPLFNVESERIQGKLADLSVKLLSLARDKDEIGVLLRGGEKGLFKPQVPLRIRQALDMNSFKKVSILFALRINDQTTTHS